MIGLRKDNGITKIGRGHFRVDFAKLRRQGLAAAFGLLNKNQPVELDPFLIARAVRGAMERCDSRSVHGKILVWNEYRVFLSSDDYQALLPLERRLRAGLDTMIRSTLTRLKADTVGDPTVRILVDEETELLAGTGEILAEYKENSELRPELDGEVTVRVPRVAARQADEVTQAVHEPAVAGALRLSWSQGDAFIAPTHRVRVGRPHAQAPDDFVALTGASRRINSYHLSLENGADGVVITRPAKANPVQVGGRLIQPGGKFSVSRLPVEISLSNGDLMLRLERVEG